MIGGQPLTQAKRQGAPVGNVIAALEMTAAALAEGLPVPVEAVKIITKSRIPVAIFRRLYAFMGGMSFRRIHGWHELQEIGSKERNQRGKHARPTLFCVVQLSLPTAALVNNLNCSARCLE
jgi:hypothetical protein